MFNIRQFFEKRILVRPYMLFVFFPESTALVAVKPPVYRAGNEREVFLKTGTTI